MPGQGKKQKKSQQQKFTSSQKHMASYLSGGESSDSEGCPCAECDSEINENDRALQCDLCENWFCNQCLKIPKSTYEMITKSKSTDGIMWFCCHCRISLPATKKLLQRLDNLESKQASYEKTIKELQKNVDISRQQNQVESVQSDNATGSQGNLNVANIVTQVLEEQHEREIRKLNVVCFGLAESQEGSAEERCQDDKTRICDIIKDDMSLNDINVTGSPIRLGRYDA